MESDSLEFGNDLYHIQFDSGAPFKEFGHGYRFTLIEAVDNCPEYLINIQVLTR
jgi:mRNA (guanine-N7-)-methyltransferase